MLLSAQMAWSERAMSGSCSSPTDYNNDRTESSNLGAFALCGSGVGVSIAAKKLGGVRGGLSFTMSSRHTKASKTWT